MAVHGTLSNGRRTPLAMCAILVALALSGCSATLPSAMVSDAAGAVSVNHDYFTDIQLTNSNPQQVTYTINPKAVWSDGTPITWEDLKSQANALSGRDSSFHIANTGGFDRVASITRGIDDRQAVVTFDRPYAQWQAQFGLIYPALITGSPQSFNTAARDSLTVSAGPFMITKLDRTQNRITLGRNPKWWAAAPKLDTITFTVLAAGAAAPALQNNELDYTGIAGLADLTTASRTTGLVVRRAPAPTLNHVTFNGASGALLSDLELRRAIAKTIDRQAVANTLQHGIVEHPTPLNNHIFMTGQRGYQDNSGNIRFDLAQAARELDALGWKLNGNVREKDGRKLELRDVILQSDQWVNVATIIKADMAEIGVTLDIQTMPGQGLFTDVIVPGNFDLAQFGWVGGPFPLEALDQIYAVDPRAVKSNFARIGSPKLNALIERTLSELDPATAITLANQCDVMIWDEAYSVPLVQSPGLVAQRANLANIGASGLASTDWTKVGFVK